MKSGKHFVVIKKLDTKNVNGNLVSNDFDIKEIAQTLGDITVDEDASHIKYENDNVFLVLVCKEKAKSMSPADRIKIMSNLR